ncbi:MAG: MogA/MoaB family molybdenum cofactor biosynthesis protein, partial [Candidatus Limnocylindrales bacterium]
AWPRSARRGAPAARAAGAERLSSRTIEPAGVEGGGEMARTFVLTVSDGVVAGTRRDESGLHLAARRAELGHAVERGLVQDAEAAIAAAVRTAVAGGHDLVILTGGTGLTSRDVTPQAVRPLLDYEAPGFGELMRAAGARSTPLAALSRSFGGVIGRALVVAVPGSPRGALESLEALVPILPHALETLGDVSSGHRSGGAAPAAAEDGEGSASEGPEG